MDTKDKNKIVTDCLQEIKMELRATEQMLIDRYGKDTADTVMKEIHTKLITIK